MPGELFNLKIEFDDEGITTQIEDVDEQIKNISDSFQELGDFISEEFEKQFKTEGRHFGKQWDQLKVPRKGGGILNKTGDLKASFTDRSALGHFESISDDEFIYGSVLPTPDGEYTLSLLHQYGTKRMVARKILVWGREFVEGIYKIIYKFIRKPMKDSIIGNAILDQEFSQVIGDFTQ